MNDFEQQLTTWLDARSESVDVTLDLDGVKSGDRRAVPESSVPSHARLLAAAAVVLLVGGGVLALTQLRSTGMAPQAAQQTVAPSDPYAGLPREGPTLTDHWHVSYGIDVCGEWIELAGDLEDVGEDLQLVNQRFASSGIHSHDDGLMHIHPFGSAGVGVNATLGTFLTNYGVVLTDDSLSFPPTQTDGRQVSEFDGSCGGGGGGGEDGGADGTNDNDAASLAVIVWPDPGDPTNRVIVTEQLAGTPLGADGIVMVLAFTDDPASVEMPPSVVDADENARMEG